jgi:hypothetical protein
MPSFDVSGVIIDAQDAKSKLIALDHGLYIPPEHCKSTKVADYGLSPAMYKRDIAGQLYQHPRFLEVARLLPGAREGLIDLYGSIGFMLMTSRDERDKPVMLELFDLNHVPVTSDDITVLEQGSKGPAVHWLNSGLHVDDDATKLNDIATYCAIRGIESPFLLYMKGAYDPVRPPQGTLEVSGWRRNKDPLHLANVVRSFWEANNGSVKAERSYVGTGTSRMFQ